MLFFTPHGVERKRKTLFFFQKTNQVATIFILKSVQTRKKIIAIGRKKRNARDYFLVLFRYDGRR